MQAFVSSHPDSSLHKYSRILYVRCGIVILTADYNNAAVFCTWSMVYGTLGINQLVDLAGVAIS